MAGGLARARVFRDRRWLIRSVMALWFVSSLFAAFLQYQLNGIVNVTLYDYGLQFSNGWALQYWALERLYYVCLFVPSLLGGFALVFDLWRSRLERVPAVRSVENNVAKGRAAPAVQTGAKGTSKMTAPAVQIAGRDNSMMISCPKCKKLFSTPLNMLDFSSGNAQLINVCPYCNHVLGHAGHTDMNIRVIEPNEKEEIPERR